MRFNVCLLYRVEIRLKVGRICGIDISPKMVKHTQSRFGQEATFIRLGDMSKLEGAEDSSFSAVLNNFALHHVPKAVGEEYFVQWARVLLQPNGRLFVSMCEGTGDQDMGDMLSPGQQVYFHRWSKSDPSVGF